jgi:hypothetical protein
VLADLELWPPRMPHETSAPSAMSGDPAPLAAAQSVARCLAFLAEAWPAEAADLAVAFVGTSVLWARLHSLIGRPDPDAEVGEADGYRAR